MLLTHQADVFRLLAPRLRSSAISGLCAPLRVPKSGSTGVMLLPGIGAPLTAMAVEEAAAIGVRQVLRLDYAGSISSSLAAGAVVIAGEAIAADGTSGHYAPGQPRLAPSSALASRIEAALSAAGLSPLRGTVWSTDAPYRETVSVLQAARDQGAVAVDMETAALYAAGAAVGIETLAVLVIGDQVVDRWTPPGDIKALRSVLHRAARAAFDAIAL
jgi:uridine phosphorylase